MGYIAPTLTCNSVRTEYKLVYLVHIAYSTLIRFISFYIGCLRQNEVFPSVCECMCVCV